METARDVVGRTIGFLPDLVAGLIVLAIGWVIAAVLRRAVVALLPRLGFDRFLVRHRVIARPPESRTGSGVVGTAIYWVVMLVALMQAANIWRLTFVARGLARVLAYLPNVAAAVIIFGAAFIIANWVGDRLRASPSEQRSSILPGAVRAAILTIGAFVALREMLIAPEILVIGFTLVFGAIAVATALAFGLGGRRTAEQMTQDWYERQRRRPRVVSPEEVERPGLEEPPGPGIH